MSKWLENPIYKPFRPFGRGPAILGDVTNHSYQPLTNWDDPPSTGYGHYLLNYGAVGRVVGEILDFHHPKSSVFHELLLIS